MRQLFRAAIISVSFLLFSPTVWAQNSISTHDLTAEQASDLTKIVEAYRAANTSGTGGPSIPDDLVEFANTGYTMAYAIQIAATELNMEVDDFLRSPVGREAMSIMMWKLYGPSVLFISYSILILIVGLSLFRWFWTKNDRIVIQEREIDGKKVISKIPEAGPNQQEWRVVAVACSAITVALSAGFILNAM